jgi:hypothetical protein
MRDCKSAILDMPAAGTGPLAGPLRAELPTLVDAGARAIHTGVSACIDAYRSASTARCCCLAARRSRVAAAPPCASPGPHSLGCSSAEAASCQLASPVSTMSVHLSPIIHTRDDSVCRRRVQCPSLSRRRGPHVPDTRSETVVVLTLFLLVWI